MLQNALDVGVGVNIDSFRPAPPSTRLLGEDELSKRKTLIFTSDEEPAQTGSEFFR